MARKCKEYRVQTYKMDADVVRRMDKYSEVTGIPKTFIAEQAIKAYLDEKMPETVKGV